MRLTKPTSSKITMKVTQLCLMDMPDLINQVSRAEPTSKDLYFCRYCNCTKFAYHHNSGCIPWQQLKQGTLSLVLTSSGITVKQAESDADTLIVSTAFQMAKGSERDQPVVVVGTDTDLLVMLGTYVTSSMDMFMLCHRNPIMLNTVEQLHQALGSTR